MPKCNSLVHLGGVAIVTSHASSSMLAILRARTIASIRMMPESKIRTAAAERTLLCPPRIRKAPEGASGPGEHARVAEVGGVGVFADAHVRRLFADRRVIVDAEEDPLADGFSAEIPLGWRFVLRG